MSLGGTCLRVKFLLQDREDSKSNPLGSPEILSYLIFFSSINTTIQYIVS